MRTVFTSNEECLHIWAQQKQALGRANSVFFRDSVAFSYGEHFPMARILTTRKGQITLVTTRRYSVTTEKHKGMASSAVRGLMPSFPSPDIYDLNAAIKYNDDIAKGSVAQALKRMKVTVESSIRFELDTIRERFQQASVLRKHANKGPIFPNPKDLAKVAAHLQARLKRYRELNTPEAIAKRAAKRAAEINVREARSIASFRAGSPISLRNLPFDLLRIHGDQVETSRHAKVPLEAARDLCRALLAGRSVTGLTIGGYTVTNISPMEKDKLISIGCHRILLSEACAVLGVSHA